VIGGTLMGLANLVPGISGGTMLLAVGVYPHFINGIAQVSTVTFRATTLLTLACIVGPALLAVLLFAGAISELVVNHRWIMYSIFIGLTLGGVPVTTRNDAFKDFDQRRTASCRALSRFFSFAFLAPSLGLVDEPASSARPAASKSRASLPAHEPRCRERSRCGRVQSKGRT
jgi:uncharacterized membrane protein